ncbi:MAG: VOC family protein [Candidatus Heimdallarchaeota archaeon]|nr:VOC family protein [Candidatus Heimdallarchaeota archaeon]
MITRINSILIFVNDLTKSISFYQETLNLSLIHKNPNMAQFIISDVFLIIHQATVNINKNGNIHFNLEVQQLNEFVEGLKLKGVIIKKEIHNPGFGYLVATILDNEENEIDLLEKIK